MRISRLAPLVICLLASFAARPAAARTLTIQEFNEQVTIQSDGTVDVTEIIQAHFTGHWNGIYRTIPVDYTGPGGLNYSLFLDVVSVTDDSGASLKYQRSRQGHSAKFKIWVPNAEDATRTVIFHYRVLDALRFFDDHDEFYWNVTGNEWEVPIESASAHIELPAGVTGLHAVAYTGTYGSRAQDAQVAVEGDSVEVTFDKPLLFHQGLTAVVGWDKGFVHAPSVLQILALYARSNWPLALPVFVLLIMFWLWWTRGRDPERDAVTVQYEPPDKLTPGECGTLVDGEAAMRDITATLVDLAVKGYFTIEQIETSHMLGLSHSKDFVLHLKKPAAEWAGARAHELEMLGALFDGGANTDVKFSDLQNHFYTHLPKIRDGIFDALVTDGYYLHRPDTVRQSYIGAGFLVGFLMVFFSGAISAFTGTSGAAWFLAGFASGIVICAFGWFMPARTVLGARTYEKVLGFEQFLGRVESDRIERLEKTPETFEKFLPYAMALHVEKKWVQAFSGINMPPPQWYQGNFAGGFQPMFLLADLNLMSVQASSAMASSPRSAGGSGFGGGGGAGGGFGGGGGGGF